MPYRPFENLLKDTDLSQILKSESDRLANDSLLSKFAIFDRHRLLPVLFTALEKEGIKLSLDRQIRLQRLLSVLPELAELENLAFFLCPIIATDEQQQVCFYKIFKQILMVLPKTEIFLEKDRLEKLPNLHTLSRSQKNLNVEISSLPKPRLQPFENQKVSKTSLKSQLVLPPKPKLSSYLYDKPSSTSPQSKLTLDLDQCIEPPFVWNIAPNANIPIETGPNFGHTLASLRSRKLTEATTIDWISTIHSTIKQAGMPVLHFRYRTRPAEYLLLVERFCIDDHRALLFDQIWRVLRDHEVTIERFFHDGDLRSCYNEQFPTGIGLRELSYRFSHSHLLVLGDGYRLLKPGSGQMAEWTYRLFNWKSRSLLTSVPRQNWGVREHRLSDIFTLLPLSFEALQFVAENSQNSENVRYAELPAYVRAAAEWPSMILEKPLMRSLKQHFDSEICTWIATCALWPSLHFDLTLRLGRLLSSSAGNLLTFSNLTHIARLEWFINGYIPKDDREELIEYLEARNPVALRQTNAYLLTLLEENIPDKNKKSLAFAEHQINIAILRHISSDNNEPGIVEKLRTVLKRLNWVARRTDFVLPATIKKILEKIGLIDDSNVDKDSTWEKLLEEGDTSDEKSVNIDIDQKIIQSLRSGGRLREQAWEYIYRNWRGKVVKTINEKGGDKSEALDAIAEIALQFERTITRSDFVLKSKLSTFFVTCVFRYWKNKVEKVKIIESNEWHIADFIQNIETDIDKSELTKLIEIILLRLGERCAAVLRYSMNGFSATEIAKKMNFANDQFASLEIRKCHSKFEKYIREHPSILEELNNQRNT